LILSAWFLRLLLYKWGEQQLIFLDEHGLRECWSFTSSKESFKQNQSEEHQQQLEQSELVSNDLILHK